MNRFRIGQCPRKPIEFIVSQMEGYTKNCSSYQSIRDLISKETGVDQLQNDHVAVRGFSNDHTLRRFESILTYGNAYRKMDTYDIPEKHLIANWYSPLYTELPRVFVSELQTVRLPSKERSIIDRCFVDNAHPSDTETDINVLIDYTNSRSHCNPQVVEYNDYMCLIKVSDYAAWTLIHGHRINHMTISVHDLSSHFDQFAKFLDFLESYGYNLLRNPYRIQLSHDKLLEQASIVSDVELLTFEDGATAEVPGTFVEFIWRHFITQNINYSLQFTKYFPKLRRDGFEAKNASKIFESTKNK